MSAYVFVGPSLAAEEVRAAGDFICLPPAAQGDVYRLVQAGARVIGLIDGYFVEIDGRGPPRKYYRIADSGRDRLNEWTREWERLSSGVTTLLLESATVVVSTPDDHVELHTEGEQHGF